MIIDEHVNLRCGVTKLIPTGEQSECDVREHVEQQLATAQFAEPKKRGRPVGSTRQEHLRGSELPGSSIHGYTGLVAAPSSTNYSGGKGVSTAADVVSSYLNNTGPITPRKAASSRDNLSPIRSGNERASSAPRKIAKVASKNDPTIRSGKNDGAEHNGDNGRVNGHDSVTAAGTECAAAIQRELTDD